jgi:hypothetical protein
VYRRANTSLSLTSPGMVDSDPDPYISCSNILDRFSASGHDASAYNGNGAARKMSASAIKDFLLGRRDHPAATQPAAARLQDRDNSYVHATSAGNPYESALIEDLTVSPVPRLQPKYSYLIGHAAGQRAADGDTDFWRKSNAVSIVNNNLYRQPSPAAVAAAPPSRRSLHQLASVQEPTNDHDRPNYTSYISSTHRSYLNEPSSASSGSGLEDRLRSALQKGSTSAVGNPASSYNVKKSRSYGNFDSANRDYNYQVNYYFNFKF